MAYPIRVTDRALVEFLARAGGFDVEAVRGALERSLKRASTAAGTIGEGDYVVYADGLRYVVENSVLITVQAVRTATRRRPLRR